MAVACPLEGLVRRHIMSSLLKLFAAAWLLRKPRPVLRQ